MWREYKARKIQAGDQKQSVGPAPPEPDIGKFAKDHGLVAGRTGLMAEWDLRDTGIGQSVVGRGAYLWRYAFQSVPYRSEISQDLKDGKGSLFMFWKTDDEKEQVPKFEDVRAEVLRAWKLIRARDLALEAAKKLAAEAQKANQPLKQVFADQPERHVILPSKFTWLNFGNVAMSWQQPARLSTVEGVQMPGWDFMREVFSLERGQVSVAFNAPKTIAYVVRPSEFTPSYETLRTEFETEPYGMYVMASRKDYDDMREAWLDEIKKSVGFAWGPGHRSERLADYAPAGEDY